MTGTRALFICVLCVCGLRAQAQTTQPQHDDSRTALIVGQVTDAGTGRPVGGVIVTLTSGGALAPPAVSIGPVGSPPLPRVMTGSDGQFAFRDLSKGSYSLTAMKPGHIDGAYGRRRPGGLPQQVTLEEGQKTGDIAIPIWKYATISGTVVDEAGEPVVGVQLRALRRTYVAGRPKFTAVITSVVSLIGVTTDDRGMYRLSGLTPGDYVVVVESMQGSVPFSTLQAYRDPGTMPSSQFSQIFQIKGPTSLPGVSPAALQLGNSVLSLSRGGLTPPQPAEGKVFVYPTTYYPTATTVARAAIVTVGSGEERSAVDFQLSPVATSRVSGTLAGDPDAVANVQLWLNSAESQESGIGVDSAAATITGENGAFTFPAVPMGQYTLRALKQPPARSSTTATTVIQSGAGVVFTTTMSGSDAPTPIPAEPTMFALVPLSVGRRDVTELTIPLQTGPRVTGRIEFDGVAPRPTPEQLERITVMLEGVAPGGGSGLPPGRADRSGAFTSYSVPAGKYFVRPMASLSGWTFRAATYNGRDLAETPLDLEGADVTGVVLSFTDRPTEFSGTVQSSDGRADADATVLLFPSDPQSWTNPGQQRRFRAVRTTKSGGFKTAGLPAGSYYAVAVPDDAIGEWTDPRVLDMLAKVATEVQLDEGDKKSQDLRTKEVR